MFFKSSLTVAALVSVLACSSIAKPGDAANVAVATAAETTNPAPAPQWYLDDIAFMTRDGGRWIAPNADYQNENEPFEAYGLEWKMDYANSITGRLFGIQDGEETGDFWRFRQYWNAHEGRAIIQQFGFGGAIGVGTMEHVDGATKMEQMFFGPDGVATPTGHIAHNDGEKHVTASYTITDDVWEKDRQYTWERQPEAPAN